MPNLFLSETRAYPYDIDDIALYYANVGQMAPAETLELLAFAFPLLLLLREALMTGRDRSASSDYN